MSVPRTALGAADDIATLDARAVLFSQSNVRKTLPDIVQSMRANGWQGDAIDVVRLQNGTLVAVDNTRLAAAKLTGTPLQARIRAFDEAFPIARDVDNMHFSSLTTGARPTSWGEAVFNRWDRQNPIWKRQYPFGSPFTGVHKSSGPVLP